MFFSKNLNKPQKCFFLPLGVFLTVKKTKTGSIYIFQGGTLKKGWNIAANPFQKGVPVRKGGSDFGPGRVLEGPKNGIALKSVLRSKCVSNMTKS